MNSTKPIILVTNDDGITAPGIKILTELMQELGEVVVVAPDKPHSGTGHAITLRNILRLNEISNTEKLKEYSCSGTPVDCVKLAVNVVLHKKPDLCVSGINHGSNSSINVIYSGTMSAALEGAIENIPSIGFSLCNTSVNADFSTAKKYVKLIAEKALKHGLPDGTCLNPENDTEANKVPSCPQCNRMKSSMSIEAFRATVGDFIESLNKYSTQYKFAKKYLLVEETQAKVTFWFEFNFKHI